MIEQPLVSLIIPTFRRADLLMERSLPSAMSQTYTTLDIHVVGDGTDQETVDAMATVTDPRVRFTNIKHQHYPEQSAFFAWCVSGTDAINHGLDTALGTWVSTLGDDDEYCPNYVERLLEAAAEQDVDAIYGRSVLIGQSGETLGYLGAWPPGLAKQTCDLLWRINEVRMDPECYMRGNLPNDWDLWEKLMASGLRWGFIPEVLYRYHPSEHVPGSSPT